MTNNKLAKYPEIQFTKVFCPFCGEPTGPSTMCYTNGNESQTLMNNGQILPIFSEACYFRQANLWKASLNYPVSKHLMAALNEVDGIEKIEPTAPHEFNFIIGRLFDEKIVKRDMAVAYRNMIKSASVSSNAVTEESVRKIKAIKFPHGKKFTLPQYKDQDLSNEQQEIVQNIIDKMPDAEPLI